MSDSIGTVLVVDDDAAIRHAIVTTLTALSFVVPQASCGEEAIMTVKGQPLDAILLDVSMPGMGGLEACRQIRRYSATIPVLMLTVFDSQDDVVEAFNAGADDYITKPFDIRELTARLKRAVSRNRLAEPAGKTLAIGNIELDPARRSVKRDNRPIRLTPKEFDLLQCLMENAGVPVAHAKLLRAIWGPEYGEELEYLRVFIRQLRLKIESDPSRPIYLQTAPYVGYRFCSPTPVADSSVTASQT